MHLGNSIRIALVCLTCLTTVSGCKMFTSRFTNDQKNAYSNPDSPSQRLRPRTLDHLTGQTRDDAPPIAPSFGPIEDPAQIDDDEMHTGIGLDDVSLHESDIHVEADIDPEDIQKDTEDQLPKIVASAVHPFSSIGPPITITDQPTQDELADHVDPATPSPSTQVAEDDHANAIQTDVNSGSSDTVMRMTAETDQPLIDGQASKTDLLFDDGKQNDIQPEGDVSIVIDDTVPALTDSQTPEIQQVTHQQSPMETVESKFEAPATPRQTPKIQALTWDQQLIAAIHQLDRQIKADGDQADAKLQIKLQLLRIAADQPSPESPVINSDNDSMRQYWTHQLNALSLMLIEKENANTAEAVVLAAKRRRVTEASDQLEHAHSQLARISSLRLSECAFANEVRGFGQFSPASSTFQSGQQVLVYCEIENYSVRQTDYSGEIQQVAELQGQFSIIDANNRVVYQHQYQPVKDTAQRRRKDFYMFFPVTVPQMGPGQYRLQMSVEDLVGNKVASSREDLVFNVSALAKTGSTPRVATAATTQNHNPPSAADAKKTTPRIDNGNRPLPINNNHPLPVNGNQPLPANRR